MSHGIVCQCCQLKFATVCKFKEHMCGKSHKKQIAEIFHTNVFRGQVNGHIFVVLEHLVSPIINQPVIGLSLVTTCLTSESSFVSYLCHACEELCSHGQIQEHLHSADHYINYYTYKDPDELSFSWIPSTEMLAHIRPVVQKEEESNGHGELWVLDLPKHLTAMFKTSTCTYGKVMEALGQIDELVQRFKVDRPQRITIQAYQKNPNRTHPLLGLQHLLEYSCAGLSERKSYLCILCSLSFPAHKIIKHILGFDHIYAYFKKWHPGTLLIKDVYKEYTSLFSAVMYDLANQAQALNESPTIEIKRVVLEPAMFTSVSNLCSSRAFEKLESVWKQCNQSSLKTQVKPGDKLVPFSYKCEGSPPVMETIPETDKIVPFSHKCEGSPPVMETIPETDKIGSGVQSCNLACQDCKVIFRNVMHYKRHVRNEGHRKVLNCIFGTVEAHGQQVFIPSLDLYNYLKNEKRTEPVIGVSMMFICLSTKAAHRTFYLCFACQDKYPAKALQAHLCSRKHLLRVLMRLCPYKLPFAWEKNLDRNVLKSLAWEFERNSESKERMIKVFDIARSLFNRLGHTSFTQAMQLLTPFQFFLRAERQLKYREFQGKLTFPLIGVQFLVQYSLVKEGMKEPEWGFLCVLCKRKLSEMENWAHLLSREHVASFLNAAHPGSLEVRLSREMFLDLANQAKKFHSNGYKQVVRMNNPIKEPVTYETAFFILNAVKKRCGTGCLVPTLPTGKKLVPTGMSETTPQNNPVKEKPESGGERQKKMGKENSDKTVGVTQGTETGKEVLNDTIIIINSGIDAETEMETETETTKGERGERDSETGSLARTGPNTDQEMGREISGVDGKLMERWTRSKGYNMPTKLEANTEDGTSKGKETMEEAIKCGGRWMGLESTKYVENDIEKEMGRETVKGGVKEMEKEMKGKTLEESVKEPEGQMRKTAPKCIVKEIMGESCKEQIKMLSIYENKKTTAKRKMWGIFGKKPKEASKRRRLSAETENLQKASEAKKCLEREPNEDYGAVTSTVFGTKTRNLSGMEKVNSHCNPTPCIELWNFLKRKVREAVIGLNALIECNSDEHSPFYLCVICKLLIQEALIVQHVVGDAHRAKCLWFLKGITIRGKKRRRTWRFESEQLEKEIGCGEAQAIQLDPALYNTLAQSNFAYAIKMVKKLVEQQTSNPSSQPTVDYQGSENPILPVTPATPIRQIANRPTSPSAPVTQVTPESGDCPDPTRASPHLWDYLNATSRTQPVIGLSMMLEIQFPGVPTRNYFDCACCSETFNGWMYHLISARHRYSYIKEEHPHLIHDWPATVNPGMRVSQLRKLAVQLEKEEGWGQLEVIIQDAAKMPKTTVNNEANSTEARHLSRRHPELTYDSECPGLTESVRPLNEQLGQEATQQHNLESSGTLAVVVGANAVVAEEAGQQPSDSVSGATETKGVTTVILRTTEPPSAISHGTKSTNETKTTSKKEPETSKTPVTSSSAVPTKTMSETSVSWNAKETPLNRKEARNAGATFAHISKTVPTFETANNFKASEPVRKITIDPAKGTPTATTLCTTGASSILTTPPKVTIFEMSPLHTAYACDASEGPSIQTVAIGNIFASLVQAEASSSATSITVPVTNRSALSTPTVTPGCKTVPAEPTRIYKKGRRRRRAPSVVGLNHMVAVSCGRRRRYFCKLCGVRLKHSRDHLEAFSHRYNFVRFWRPGWTACPSKLEIKLSKIVSGLSKAERNADIAMQKVNVTKEEYSELVAAPLIEALGQLEVIIKKQADGELPESFKTNPEPVVLTVAAPSTNENAALHSPEGASKSGLVAKVCLSSDSQSNLDHTPQSLLVQIPIYLGNHRRLKVRSPLKPDSEVHVMEHMDTRFHLSPIPYNPEVKSPKSQDGQNLRGFSERQLPPVCPAREPVPFAPSPKSSVETVLHTPAASQCQGQTQSKFGLVSNINARERDVGPSHLSKYLKEKGLHDTEPVIGLKYILECRGISQMTFLCMSCAKALSVTNICDHIISVDHQICHMEIEYPNLLLPLWKVTDVPDSTKTVILRELFLKFSDLEMKEDAQVMLLEQEWYEHVQTASFNKALEYLQSVRRNLNLHPLNLPQHTTTQQSSEPQDQSSPVEPSLAPQTANLTEVDGSRAIDGELGPIPREMGNGSLGQPEKDQSLPIADKAVQQTPDQPQASEGSQRAQASPPPTRVQNLQITIKQEVIDPELDLLLLSEIKSGPLNEVSFKQEVIDFDAEVQSCVRDNTTIRKEINLLQKYVQSKRTEAIVGLCALIQCSSEGQAPFYLCVSCGSKLNRDLIINHVLKYKHRQNYLQVRYPWYFRDMMVGNGSVEELSIELMQIAKEVEEQNHDEPGTVQEVHLVQTDFTEIRLMSFNEAVTRLQAVCRKRNHTDLLTCIIGKTEPVAVKKELVECPVISRDAMPSDPLQKALSSEVGKTESFHKHSLGNSDKSQVVQSRQVFSLPTVNAVQRFLLSPDHVSTETSKPKALNKQQERTSPVYCTPLETQQDNISNLFFNCPPKTSSIHDGPPQCCNKATIPPQTVERPSSKSHSYSLHKSTATHLNQATNRFTESKDKYSGKETYTCTHQGKRYTDKAEDDEHKSSSTKLLRNSSSRPSTTTHRLKPSLDELSQRSNTPTASKKSKQQANISSKPTSTCGLNPAALPTLKRNSRENSNLIVPLQAKLSQCPQAQLPCSSILVSLLSPQMPISLTPTTPTSTTASAVCPSSTASSLPRPLQNAISPNVATNPTHSTTTHSRPRKREATAVDPPATSNNSVEDKGILNALCGPKKRKIATVQAFPYTLRRNIPPEKEPWNYENQQFTGFPKTSRSHVYTGEHTKREYPEERAAAASPIQPIPPSAITSRSDLQPLPAPYLPSTVDAVTPTPNPYTITSPNPSEAQEIGGYNTVSHLGNIEASHLNTNPSTHASSNLHDQQFVSGYTGLGPNQYSYNQSTMAPSNPSYTQSEKNYHANDYYLNNGRYNVAATPSFINPSLSDQSAIMRGYNTSVSHQVNTPVTSSNPCDPQSLLVHNSNTGFNQYVPNSMCYPGAGYSQAMEGCTAVGYPSAYYSDDNYRVGYSGGAYPFVNTLQENYELGSTVISRGSLYALSPSVAHGPVLVTAYPSVLGQEQRSGVWLGSVPAAWSSLETNSASNSQSPSE